MLIHIFIVNTINMEQECKKHGLSEFALRHGNRWRCKKCAVEAVQKRRDKVKKMAVEYKGGKCQNPECGYNKCIGALEFHHFDGKKDFGLSDKGYTRSWEVNRKELDKCVMLCANCHREVHAGFLDVFNLTSSTHYDVNDKKYKHVCVDCGVDIDHKAIRCSKCYKLTIRRVNRPPLDQLQVDINLMGYSATGRKYGVSDNAIRKWLKQ